MIWNPFKKRPEEDTRPLDVRLRELEEHAKTSGAGYEGQHLNRAGDLCAAEGDATRALRYWGAAIDAYLNAARPEAAAAVCRKVIRQEPNVVRARRTLALLAIGQGHLGEALEQADAYVEAAMKANGKDLAVKQLRLMGEATWSERFRRHIAELLERLGDEEGAAHVRRPLDASQVHDDSGPMDDEHDRWSTILRVALMPPDEANRTL